MKKKALALSVLAAISSQAGAFQLDTGDDWAIRWDNTFKGNVVTRTQSAAGKIVDPTRNFRANAALSDDADYSVDRSSGAISSARVDLISELDVVWRDNWGFRISGAGWYDEAYSDGDNPDKGTLPTTGLPYDYSWSGLNYEPGEYSDKAQDLSYRGGELLDAFVFGNWDIGNTALGVRAGRHTIYWGQSVFGAGALTGIAGSMAAIDFGKALAVPGSEAKELFMPSTKISAVFQMTDNLALAGYYEFEHVVHRFPATGTFMSPSEVLTENTEFATFVPGTATSARLGLKGSDDKIEDEGEFGFNLQYYVEFLDVDTEWVYIKGSDRLLSGVWGSFAPGQVDADKVAQWAKPWAEGGANANVIGEFGWVYKNDIETYGISLAKEMLEISWGMDIVFRDDTGLNPNFLPSFTTRGAATADDFGPSDNKFPGPTGDVWGVVVNGLGFLDSDWGMWDGGIWIVEYTTSWLDKFEENEHLANTPNGMRKGRVTTQMAALFSPRWYNVFPGWDMTIPMNVSYSIDGEQPAQSSIPQEEYGTYAIGVNFLVDQVWNLTARYSDRFGPVKNGVGGGIVDRGNLAFTVKRTW
jgi:hypothetical protein